MVIKVNTNSTNNNPILHQLLAVRDSTKTQAKKVLGDTMKLFTSKSHNFVETHTEFFPTVADLTGEVTASLGLQTKVNDELRNVTKYLATAIDLEYRIDAGNILAAADITIDGETIVENVPATTLLTLEGYLQEVLKMVQIVPTLDPAKNFKPDPSKGLGIYKARETKKTRTRKERQVIVLAPATDKHQQQQALVDVDAPIGFNLEQEWSSLITPAKKAELADRATLMLQAVKDARARANALTIEVDKLKVGGLMMKWILQPLDTF